MLSRTCTLCNTTHKGETKEEMLNYFRHCNNTKLGLTAMCITCLRAEKRKWYHKNNYNKPKFQHDPIKCIVCDKDFIPYNKIHKVCSKDCTNFKIKVRDKEIKKERLKASKKVRAKYIRTRNLRNKHYTKEELQLIKGWVILGESLEAISKKLKRTPTGVNKKILMIKKELSSEH